MASAKACMSAKDMWAGLSSTMSSTCRLEVLHNVGCTGPGPLLLKLLVGQMTHASLGQSLTLAVPHDQQVHTV